MSSSDKKRSEGQSFTAFRSEMMRLDLRKVGMIKLADKRLGFEMSEARRAISRDG